jgi:iron complex transport system substrate-binding protein
VYGEINVEKLAALEPELIVSSFTPLREGDPLRGFADLEQQETVAKIAPIAAFDASLSATEIIARYEELAASLGVDLESPELSAARERFDAAVEELQAAAAEKPGLTILAVSAYPDNLFVADPGDFQDTKDYVRWGLEFAAPPPETPYFETLSWERADTYPADLILHDATAPLEAIEEKPTWHALPAVDAGQLVPWKLVTVMNRSLFTESIQTLAEAIENADPDVVEP